MASERGPHARWGPEYDDMDMMDRPGFHAGPGFRG